MAPRTLSVFKDALPDGAYWACGATALDMTLMMTMGKYEMHAFWLASLVNAFDLCL
jgi:hypothetical protein